MVNFVVQNGFFISPGHEDLHDVAVWQANGFDQLVVCGGESQRSAR